MKLKLLFLFLVITQSLFAQNFIEMKGTPFEGIGFGSIAFADVDGDSDQDVLISGLNSSFEPISKLYTNDGVGRFTEMIGTLFTGVYSSSISFADVDGDSDQDVLIIGLNYLDAYISKLYTNNGAGSFTEMMGTGLAGVTGSSAFADVDGDNDQDVLITGGDDSFAPFSKLYINDGSGSFTKLMSTPFDAVTNGSNALADVDGDNDQDVLITGISSLGVISKLYINDGSGSFTKLMSTPFEGVWRSFIAFADVDGDNDQDVLISGLNELADHTSKLYTNDGSGSFTEMMGTPFDGSQDGSIAFSDVDNDNDQDVLITGSNGLDLISKLYTNDGSGNFMEMVSTPFDGVWVSSIAFADVDGDNDQDVLITGYNGLARISKLYTNVGAVSADDLKIGESLGFILYPNTSTTGSLYLRYDAKDSGDVTVKVYNINGVMLRQQKEFANLGQQIFSIDITSLPQGNYFIELNNGKRKGLAKFIVP